jgi:lysophospholipase L1-like esterase
MKVLRTVSAVILAALTAVCLTAGSPASPTIPTTRAPVSISALGDSITQSYNACLLHAGECSENSWATGDIAGSLKHQLEQKNPGQDVKAWNNAQYGAYVKDLPAQTEVTVMQKPEMVTMLAGANDLCGYTEQNITPTTDIASSYKEALDILSTKLPDTKIFVASIPNVVQMYRLDENNPEAQKAWHKAGLCYLLLNEHDRSKRVQVEEVLEQRLVQMNAVIAKACSETKNCFTDNGAVFNTEMTTADMSNHDFFHPSAIGQQHLAQVIGNAIPWKEFMFKVASHTLKGDPKKAPKVQVISPSDDSYVQGNVELRVSVKTSSPKVIPEKVYLKTKIGSYDLERVAVEDPLNANKSIWGLTVDSGLAPNGTKIDFSVVVVDSAGNVSESSPVTVTVKNSTVNAEK